MPEVKKRGSFTEGVGDIGEWLRNIIWGGGRGEAVSDWARGVGSQFGQAWMENRFPSQPRSPYQEKLFGLLGGSPPSPTGVSQRTTDILSGKVKIPPEQDVSKLGEGSPRNEDRWEIENIGGQDYIVLVHYDETGRRTINPGEAPRPVKKEPTQGDRLMQDYYDLQRQKDLMQFQRDLNTPRNTTSFADAAYAQQIARAEAEVQRMQQQRDMFSQFEQARREILSTTAPRDWVIREKAQRVRNPFALIQTPYGTVNLAGTPPDVLQRYAESVPDIPEDIRQFVGAGIGEEKEFGTQIAPPSGQQWTRSPWDTREMLAGYAEAFGEGGFQNLQEEMRRRQPYNPSRGAMWSPARQR